jgi:hypothetical protein
MGRPIKPPKRAIVRIRTKRKAAAPPEPSWPSFPGGAIYVATSGDGRVDIWVDPSLGVEAEQNATDLVNDADRIGQLNDSFFGTPAGNVSVVLFALGGPTDGSGGADHMGCDFATGQNIEVDVSFGHSMRCSALFEAELSECMMDNNLCGLSTGEALSRWCAMLVSQNALGDFASAPVWAQDGMPNFVDQVDPTDTNYDSIGCGMAFLSWLQGPLGIAFPTIAQAMVSGGDGLTLAQLYTNLTGDAPSNAWPKFQAAVAALPLGVNSDDPFGEAQPQPAPAPQPGPSPQPGPCPPPGPAPSPSPAATFTIDQDLPAGSYSLVPAGGSSAASPAVNPLERFSKKS